MLRFNARTGERFGVFGITTRSFNFAYFQDGERSLDVHASLGALQDCSTAYGSAIAKTAGLFGKSLFLPCCPGCHWTPAHAATAAAKHLAFLQRR